jgi:hypothetical protein
MVVERMRVARTCGCAEKCWCCLQVVEAELKVIFLPRVAGSEPRFLVWGNHAKINKVNFSRDIGSGTELFRSVVLSHRISISIDEIEKQGKENRISIEEKP